MYTVSGPETRRCPTIISVPHLMSDFAMFCWKKPSKEIQDTRARGLSIREQGNGQTGAHTAFILKDLPSVAALVVDPDPEQLLGSGSLISDIDEAVTPEDGEADLDREQPQLSANQRQGWWILTNQKPEKIQRRPSVARMKGLWGDEIKWRHLDVWNDPWVDDSRWSVLTASCPLIGWLFSALFGQQGHGKHYHFSWSFLWNWSMVLTLKKYFIRIYVVKIYSWIMIMQ